MSIVLIGGGSRSGKSSFALSYARRSGERRGFLATAEAFDDEMRERIERHREDRGPDFVTLEEPLEIERVIADHSFDVLVIDCLTLWLSNLLHAGRSLYFDGFIDAAAQSPMTCVLVTNEVGCGIVPENALARQFRDLAGTLNQQVAARAAEVYWMVFGVPMRVK